jgi:glutamate/tyrosine decarboxylase-like PLP-dependent enzyme
MRRCPRSGGRASRIWWITAATEPRKFAESIATLPGCEVLNEVALNQVLFRFADDETTLGVLEAVQKSGEAWMGGTTWDDHAAIRLSVSNWRTTETDIERTVATFEAALVAV